MHSPVSTDDRLDTSKIQVQSMPVILRSNQSFEDIVSVHIAAFGGPTAEPLSGSIDLLLRTMGSGTPSYSKEEIDRLFAEAGASFKAESRGDYLEIALTCLKRFLPTLLPVISEMMTKPLLDPKEIELSREQMRSDLKGETDHPDGLIRLVMHEAFYQGHPYLARSSGFLSTIDSIQRDDLLRTKQKMFNKQNLLFTWVGDFDVQEVEGLMGRHFAEVSPGERQAIVREPAPGKPKQIIYKTFESPTDYFLAQFSAPALIDADFPAMVLACQILSNQFFEEVRTERALTYSVSCSLDNSAVNAGSLYVSSTKLAEALSVMGVEIKKLQDQPLESDRVALQVKKYVSSWYLARETSSSQAHILNLYEVIGPGWQTSEGFIKRLEAVRPEDIQRVAKNYLRNFTSVVVGPKNPELKIDWLTQ